jgi:hypothetical protein
MTTSGCITIRDSNFIHPQRGTEYIIDSVPASYKKSIHSFKREDGTVTYGLSFVRSDGVANVVYFGGNEYTVNSPRTEGLLKVFESLPVNLFFFDRRGYGKSSGTPNVDNIMSDANLIIDYVKSISSKPLIVYGQSLGSFEAGSVAAEKRIDGLILESSATTVQEWIDSVDMPLIFSFAFVKIDESLQSIDNTIAVKRYSGPTLILVGEHDKNTPPVLSKKLFDSSSSKKKKLVVIKTASHNDVPFKRAFQDVIQEYISSYYLQSI